MVRRCFFREKLGGWIQLTQDRGRQGLKVDRKYPDPWGDAAAAAIQLWAGETGCGMQGRFALCSA